MVSIQVLATPMMRLGEVRIGEPDAFEHGARRRAVAPVGNSAATMFEIHDRRRMRRPY
jgi:hypothetical protein